MTWTRKVLLKKNPMPRREVPAVGWISWVPAEAISDVTITYPTSDVVPVYEDPRRYRDQIIMCDVEWQRENSKGFNFG
jgi:hypothetical protein